MLQTVGTRLSRVFRKSRRTEGLRAAVAISDHEIAVALVRKLDGQRPKVLRIVVEEAPLGFSDPVLKKIISEFDLRRVPVSAVINPSDYQIAQVDIAFAAGVILGSSNVIWDPIGVPKAAR